MQQEQPMKSGQRATKADAGGQRLPDAAKSKPTTTGVSAPARQGNPSTGSQDKSAKKK
jgi:hypothetical protein